MSVEKIKTAAGAVKQKNIPFTLDKNEFYAFVERVANRTYAERVMVEQMPSENGMDGYELSDCDGKVLIKATSGVAAAVAFNKYLRSCCSYNIGILSVTGELPETPPVVGAVIKKYTRFHYRYLFNYCTFGYSYAFHDWAGFEKVLDWALLSGYNLVLNPIGQETVWFKVLKEIGYTAEEARSFLVGPAFMPWFLMMNMSGHYGCYSDHWFEERTELAGKFNKRLEAFGASAMMPGYAGMVPDDFGKRFPESRPIDQGTWCYLKRPEYILHDDAMFNKMAELFYRFEGEIAGTEGVHYYSVDPFHEGGIIDGVDLAAYAKGVYSAMRAHDPQAVWCLQGWQDRPEREMLNALDKSHLLVMNLLSGKNFNGGDNFAESPWVLCTVNNFGGQHILVGDMHLPLQKPFEGLNDESTMVGIGLMPEAVVTNEIFFDIASEVAFSEEKPDVEEYISDFVLRRYGSRDEKLINAWRLLGDKVFLEDTIEISSESPFCCRPSLEVDKVSHWAAHAEVRDNSVLVQVIEALLSRYEECKNNEAYIYDLVDITRQLFANESWRLVYGIQDAYKANDIDAFSERAQRFLKRFDMLEKLVSTHKNFLLGPWLERAKSLGKSEPERRWLEWNARTLITVWAPKIGDVLHDYSAREYSGLISDFYKKRWEVFISMAEISLLNGTPIPEYEAYDQEVTFSYERKCYPTESNGEAYGIVKEILDECKAEF